MQTDMRYGPPTAARPRPTRGEQVQRRRLVLVVCVLSLMIIVTAVASHSCQGASATTEEPSKTTGAGPDPLAAVASASYQAQLTSPASSTAPAPAIAVLTLDYDSATGRLTHRLEVTGQLANPSIAAICQGSPDGSGSTVFTLYPGPTMIGHFTGVLVEGTIAPEDLVGPLRHGTLADLLTLLQSGDAYATIGTRDCPIDAVRGPID